jgi:hypothetical protein
MKGQPTAPTKKRCEGHEVAARAVGEGPVHICIRKPAGASGRGGPPIASDRSSAWPTRAQAPRSTDVRAPCKTDRARASQQSGSAPSAPFAGCSANARFFSRVGGAALTQASRCLSAEISRGTAAITSANLSPGLRSTAALERASSRAATGRRDLWPGGSGGGVASADAQPPR